MTFYQMFRVPLYILQKWKILSFLRRFSG